MSNSRNLSINTLLNKALMTLQLASKKPSNQGEKLFDSLEKRLSVKEKILTYNPITNYQQHTLHYAMKGLGYLPDPILEGMIGYLKGPNSKQYLHANAHLRLIFAVNNYLKTPLELMPMPELREKFTADAVAMQSPKVWQQANSNMLSNITPFTKRSDSSVSWKNEVIANADDGDMTIRCYKAGDKKSGFRRKRIYNPDETVMLFFHGGGFCIGDVDTHHEFCHAVCEQTGWSVVSVDYRLAPECPAPAALKDCITAYAWLVEHCDKLGALPSRIVLAGDSAGGGLSTLMAQQLTAPSKRAWTDLGMDGQKTYSLLKELLKPLAQMPLYPVTDIETDYPSWEIYGEGLLLDHADVAVFDAACLENSLLPRLHVLNSPMLGDNSKVCPTYIVASELDVLRDEAFAYAKQLEGYGVAVEAHTVLGAPHGFIHLMSIHQGLGQETNNIIHSFSSFVREIISTQSRLAA
ncbi:MULTISPECIES: alpha/beta hydrolase [unclassified Psychrobacter]|uniref:alpha/beta hydrolase n=1 Tax=unclassified Psychrobacter TaxID=196806 RepID=UPI003FB6C1CD